MCCVFDEQSSPPCVSNPAFSQEKHKENKIVRGKNSTETMGTDFHSQFLFGKSREHSWAEFPALDHPRRMSGVALLLKSPLHMGRHTHARPIPQCSFGIMSRAL